MSSSIEDIITAQAALIAALDARDVGAIEGATSVLATAVAGLRRVEDSGQDGGSMARLHHALRQGEAARSRVNFLADRNRQKFERLTGRHPAASPTTYSIRGKPSLWRAA